MDKTSIIKKSMSTSECNVTDLISNITQKGGPSQCVVVKFEGIAPWDNPDSLVSAQTDDLVHQGKYTAVLPLLFLIGGPSNIINMAVFYKQGLKERINVCLFSLSLTDFFNVLFDIFFYGEPVYLWLASTFTIKERYGPVRRFMINHNLGFYGFAWLSQIISAVIASERCFCVLQPLRSQTVLSTSTTTIFIIITSIVLVVLYSILMTRLRAMCVHDPLTGSDFWTLAPSRFYLDHQKSIDVLNTSVFGVAIPAVVMAVVTLTTIVTMVKLRQIAAWRALTSSNISVSAREESLNRMLVYNSIFFIICISPSTLVKLTKYFIPDLAPGRLHHNLFFVLTWLLDIMVHINSTFNIFIYYSMGSRYRQTFWELMGRGHRTSKKNENIAHTDNTASSTQ